MKGLPAALAGVLITFLTLAFWVSLGAALAGVIIKGAVLAYEGRATFSDMFCVQAATIVWLIVASKTLDVLELFDGENRDDDND